jgi:hypothetical protein
MSARATTGAWALPAALVLLASVFLIQLDLSAPPAPHGVDAPPEVFSAGRARNELSTLLGDETPHPVGSAANRALKARLMARLRALGLQPEEQRTIGCSATESSCAQVENVIAELPGTSTDTIALMAHYDSVQYAPGAGDDGAAVAALLEIARILGAGVPRRNALLLVFTDAEEAGLLGAEAFFAEHPAAKRIKAVINLEGSGSAGPVYLLRTGPTSGELMKAFRAAAAYPFAQSFTEEIFKRMPNDTDFSVVLRAGLPGIDFAFAGERNHYHTPLDTIANLDLGTLQHHGENTLPLLRALVDTDLTLTSANAVYTNIGKRHWLYWSPTTGSVLALAALALLLFASWRATVPPLRLLAATGIAIVVPVLSAGLTLAVLWLVDRVVGVRPAWPAEPWPWRLALYAVPLFVLSVLGPWATRRIGAWAVLLAAWWIWVLATLAMALWLPLAAYLFIPATLLASLAIAASTLFARPDRPGVAAAAACVALIAAAWFMLPLAWQMEITQGLRLAPAIIVPLALLALVALPAAPCDRRRVVAYASAAAIGLALVLAARVAPYSADRPQHLNFHYIQDVVANAAHVVAWSPDPLPRRIREAAPFGEARARAWLDEDEPQTPVIPVAGEAPTLTALEASDPVWHRFHVTPAAGARAVALWLPGERIGARARVAGRTVAMAARRGDASHRRILFVAPPAEGFDIELELLGDAPREAFLVDIRSTLPPAAQHLAELRGALAVPVHSGDSAAVYRRVRI